MNKTLPLAMLALVTMATVAVPSASACQYIGPAAETVNYVLYCSSFGAGDDAQSAVDFLTQEAGEIVAFLIDLVTGIPLPP